MIFFVQFATFRLHAKDKAGNETEGGFNYVINPQPDLFGTVKSMLDTTQAFPNARIVVYPVDMNNPAFVTYQNADGSTSLDTLYAIVKSDSVVSNAGENGRFSSLQLPGAGTYALVVRDSLNTRVQKVTVEDNNDKQADILYIPKSYDGVFGASILMAQDRIAKFKDYATVNYFIVNQAGFDEDAVTLAEDILINVVRNVSRGTYQLKRENIQHGDSGDTGNRFLFKYRSSGFAGGAPISFVGDYIDKSYSYTAFFDLIGLIYQEMLGGHGLHGEPRGWLALKYDHSKTAFHDGTTRTDLNAPIDQQTITVHFYMPAGGRILPFKNGVKQPFLYTQPPNDPTLEWRFIDPGLRH